MRYLVLLLPAVLALAPVRKPAPKVDPAPLQARALAGATLAFDRFVFSGHDYPAERLQYAPILKDVLGTGTTYSISFFAVNHRPAAGGADLTGPYAAIV